MSTKKLIFAAVVVSLLAAVAVLCSPQSDAQGEYTVTAVSGHGIITDSDGNVFGSAAFENGMTLEFEAETGYEFTGWAVIGDSEYTQKGSSITIKSVASDITVTAETRNYSPSTNLFSIIDVEGMPREDDTLVKIWSVGSENFTKTDGVWQGAPCTPLIVGDWAYTRAGGYLYQIDIATGAILHYVESDSLAMNYYHYISYGNGTILDTTGYKAYDLNLNYLYDIPSTLRFATYYDGYFYGCIDNGTGYLSMFKTSAEPDKDLDSSGTKINLYGQNESHPLQRYQLFAQYGQYSSLIVKNGWIFFLEATTMVGSTGYRAITAFNMETEESVTQELTGFTGMPWDDGWLTFYNGYFYLTAYCAGLFDGVIKGLENKNSAIMWVKFDFGEGKFCTPNYQDIKTPSGDTFKGIASGLVINNGRGYLLVRAVPDEDPGSNSFIAYDIAEDGTPVPESAISNNVPFSHGGLVVNTAYEDEGKVYIYMLPYDSSRQGVYLFADEYKDGKWSLASDYTKFDTPVVEWGSQAVRAGPNGELIYYIDSGKVDCYTTASKFTVNVITIDGTSATVSSGTGVNAKAVVESLYPGCIIDKDTAIMGEKTYRIYGMSVARNTWNSVSDLTSDYSATSRDSSAINAQYRYVILLADGSNKHTDATGDAGWYYLLNGEYIKCNLRSTGSMDDAVGHVMIYRDSAPTADDVPLPETMNVPFEGTETVDVSVASISTSDEGVVKVDKDDGSFTVTGITVGTAVVTVVVADRAFEINVNVLPKSTVDENGNRIVESETVKAIDGGGLEHTSDKIVTSADGKSIVRDTVIVVTDAEGATVSETVFHSETSESDGSTVTESTTVTTAADGTKTADIEYYSSTVTESGTGGVVISDTTENSLDKISGIRTDTHTVRKTLNSAVRTDITVQKFQHATNEKIGTDTVSSDVTDGLINFDVLRGDGSCIIEVPDGTSIADCADAVALLGSDAGNLMFRTGSSLTAEDSAYADSAGASVTMVYGNTTITLGPQTLGALSGDVAFESISSPSMSDVQRKVAGDAAVFDITLRSGGDVIHSIAGAVSVSVSCSIALRDGVSPAVWRIGDDGTVTEIPGASYSDGVMTFQADHLSLYALGYMPEEGGDDGDSFSVVAAAAAIAAIAACLFAAVFLFRRRERA